MLLKPPFCWSVSLVTKRRWLNSGYNSLFSHPPLLTIDEELTFEITITNLTLDDNATVSFVLQGKKGQTHLLHSVDLSVVGKCRSQWSLTNKPVLATVDLAGLWNYGNSCSEQGYRSSALGALRTLNYANTSQSAQLRVINWVKFTTPGIRTHKKYNPRITRAYYATKSKR